MIQWLKCWPNKPENRSLDPPHPQAWQVKVNVEILEQLGLKAEKGGEMGRKKVGEVG